MRLFSASSRRLASSLSASSGGTLTSVTRNTIRSAGGGPSKGPRASFAVRGISVTAALRGPSLGGSSPFDGAAGILRRAENLGDRRLRQTFGRRAALDADLPLDFELLGLGRFVQ